MDLTQNLISVCQKYLRVYKGHLAHTVFSSICENGNISLALLSERVPSETAKKTCIWKLFAVLENYVKDADLVVGGFLAERKVVMF